jgi:hypothetical protein
MQEGARQAQEYASAAYHPDLSEEVSHARSGKQGSGLVKPGSGKERRQEFGRAGASQNKDCCHWHRDGKGGHPVGGGQMSYGRVRREQPEQGLQGLSLFEHAHRGRKIVKTW